MKVAAVDGDPALEKLTLPSDFERAEQWLAGRLIPRTGMGFDVHAFAGDGPIMLGGVEIPHRARPCRPQRCRRRAPRDHRRACSALRALATSASISRRRIRAGRARHRSLFLAHAVELLREKGAIIDHLDCTIIAEEPKVGPHRAAMRARIAEIAGLSVDQVSVKATTTEGLGFTGRREGIAAQAVASIRMGF